MDKVMDKVLFPLGDGYSEELSKVIRNQLAEVAIVAIEWMDGWYVFKDTIGVNK